MKRPEDVITRQGVNEVIEQLGGRQAMKSGKTTSNPRPARRQGVADATRRLHELEVQQIELQLQNEELRAVRHDLEVSLAEYTELFDFAPVGYATLSCDGTVIEVNHTGAAIIGMTRERLRGARFAELVAKGDRTAFAALLVKAVSGVSRATAPIELSHGSHHPTVSAKATLLTRLEPTVMLTFEDITDALARQRKLAEAQRALEEADRRKDDFLAALSHELRNPLAPIRNSLYVLSKTGVAGEPVAKARLVIERQVGQLSRLIDDLLDVTRIARGKVQLQRECIDLSTVVRRVIDDHRLSFEYSGVGLESRFDAGPFFIDADPARIVQVVSNLLGNAVKFTPRGGTVVVALQRLADQVQLSVKDDGVGISPELLPRVFESFVQAPQTLERARGGLGLGLAMVKGFVEMHGGTVAADSDGLDRGSEFLLALPARPAPTAPGPQRSAPAQVRARKVLLIEDSVDTCESMRDALELTGHQVQIAYDGRRGLEVARAFQPEIVFCDIGLPGMNGYAVAKAFREEQGLRDAYLVALSGYARAEDVAKATQAGFNRHITKPPEFEVVEQVLAQAEVTRREEAGPAVVPAELMH